MKQDAGGSPAASVASSPGGPGGPDTIVPYILSPGHLVCITNCEELVYAHSTLAELLGGQGVPGVPPD